MTFQSHEVEPDFSVINVDAHEHFVPGDVSNTTRIQPPF